MFDPKSKQSSKVSGMPSKRQTDMKVSPRCSYASKKLSRGAYPLPSLIATVGGLQPVHSVTLRSVMGGCEIIDYANKMRRSEERLVVDLAMIGYSFPDLRSSEGPNNGNSSFHQQSMIMNPDQLIASDTSDVIKEDLSLLGTQKIINNNAGVSNNNYEYTNLIEGIINNVFDSTTNIRNEEKENNNSSSNSNGQNGFEFFNYDNNQIELTGTDPSAPGTIAFQNYYDPLNTSQTMNHYRTTSNLSVDGTESSSSPGSTIDVENEPSQYYNLDNYKTYRDNLEGSSVYPVGQPVVQSERAELEARSHGTFDTFEYDSLGQHLVSHTSMSMTSMVTEEVIHATTSASRKRKKVWYVRNNEGIVLNRIFMEDLETRPLEYFM